MDALNGRALGFSPQYAELSDLGYRDSKVDATSSYKHVSVGEDSALEPRHLLLIQQCHCRLINHLNNGTTDKWL